MDLIDEHDAGDFKLFFLAYDHQKVNSRGEREGILEVSCPTSSLISSLSDDR